MPGSPRDSSPHSTTFDIDIDIDDDDRDPPRRTLTPLRVVAVVDAVEAVGLEAVAAAAIPRAPLFPGRMVRPMATRRGTIVAMGVRRLVSAGHATRESRVSVPGKGRASTGIDWGGMGGWGGECKGVGYAVRKKVRKGKEVTMTFFSSDEVRKTKNKVWRRGSSRGYVCMCMCMT